MYKIRSVKYKIPDFFAHFRYVFLGIFVVLLPYLTDVHWFSKLCPWGGLQAAIPWALWNPMNPMTEMPTIPDGAVAEWFWVKMAILAVFLILFVFTARPFCKTMCPLGLIYAWFNRFSLLKIEVSEKCNECNICGPECVVDLIAYEGANNTNCIKCLECVDTCTRTAVKVGFNFRNIKLPFATSPKDKKA
jgi:polyferredoxin